MKAPVVRRRAAGSTPPWRREKGAGLRARVVATSLVVAGSLGGVLTSEGPAAGRTTAAASVAPCGRAAPPGSAICLTRIPQPAIAAPFTGVAPALTFGLTTWPTALYPADILAAYGWRSSDHGRGTGKTIALVDAYDDPSIASDLTTFSTAFTLPPCTTTNGCFTKVDQTGRTTRYPRVTAGWDTEISLDVEWAHAMAPKAKILLVEANSASFRNLFAAVSYAAGHAQYVSMSWGGTESATEASYDPTFTAHPLVSFFASSGDTASEVIYPSASPDVISVGGTRLTFDKTTKTVVSESGWATGGGGCSTEEQASLAQEYFPTYGQAGVTCGLYRGTPDVAADATPTTGVAVYDTVPVSCKVASVLTTCSGWLQFGGTSVAAPLWAGHSAADGVQVTATFVYGRNVPFYKITTGGNGRDCVWGYNLCAGLGSWSTSHGGLNPALFRATGSGTGTATVTLAYYPTTTALTAITSPVTYGSEDQRFSGHVTGVTTGYPTTVTVETSSGTTICNATLTASSGNRATFTCTQTNASLLTSGSYTVVAHYSGGKSSTPHYIYRPSTSAAQSLTVN